MKNLLLSSLLFLFTIPNAEASSSLVASVKFASLEKAKTLLSQEDDFTQSWSSFDINARMHAKNSSKTELFAMIAEQARDWTEEEQNRIKAVCQSIAGRIEKQGFTLDFPEEIYFVKTTAREEGSAAGYTRAQFIVLKETLLSQSSAELEHLVIHELFHVLTRNNPDFRKKMYALIGFNMMNPVAYPESIAAHRITNPDAPQTDSYIRLKAQGREAQCLMVLYSKKDYKKGEFFDYLNVGFLSLTGDSVKSVAYEKGEPIIYGFGEVEGFYDQVGRNTNYIIHPEEIMAENFSFAILGKTELANPELVKKVKAILRG